MKDFITPALRWVLSGLGDWLTSLGGPQAPLFHKGASFDRSSSRFGKLLTISVILTLVPLMFLGRIDYSASRTQETLFLLCTLAIAVLAATYSFYARIFRVHISPKQAFFALAFTALPWLPIIAFIVIFLPYIPFLVYAWVPGFFILVVYLLWLESKGISLVSGAAKFNVFVSLASGPLLLALCLLFYRGK